MYNHKDMIWEIVHVLTTQVMLELKFTHSIVKTFQCLMKIFLYPGSILR